MALLLDTCAALWIVGGAPISQAANAAMDDEHGSGKPISVSPITGWEIGLLAMRGRFTSPYSPRKWFDLLLGQDGIRLAPLSHTVLIDSSFLPAAPPRDPGDRIIIATARQFDLTIVTRDRLILDYAEAGHVRAIAC